MRLYFPGSSYQSDVVGYNHLVNLFHKALGAHICQLPEGADFRVYCNLPWYHSPEELKSVGKLSQKEFLDISKRMHKAITPEEKFEPTKVGKNELPLLVYTMYESTKVPASWIKFLNKHAAAILVPSQWSKTMFECNGVTKPIFILSGCFDETRIQPIAKINALDKYVFLWQGVALDKNGRKGADIVHRAFKELRSEHRIGPDARLIMKYRPYPESEFMIDRIDLPSGITYIQGNLSRTELLELYSEVDACINPTHGEGFGLIPLEQMAMGKPVLVTNWSMDYVNPEVCVPLKYELKQSPVTWNHRFLRIWKNGYAYNFGGVAREVKILPPLMHKIADGLFLKNSNGNNPKGMAFVKAIFHNLICSLQKKTGLYFRPDRVPYTLFQENPGMDAHVDIEDLKNKMEWCYLNRQKADYIGLSASCYAHSEWGMSRMQKDFDKIMPELYKIAYPEGV